MNQSLSVAQLVQSLLLFSGVYIRKEKFGGDSLLIKFNCFHLVFECMCEHVLTCSYHIVFVELENSHGRCFSWRQTQVPSLAASTFICQTILPALLLSTYFSYIGVFCLCLSFYVFGCFFSFFFAPSLKGSS